MFCINCGKKLSEDEKFCTNCGKKAEIQESSQKNNTSEPKSNNEAFNKLRKSKLFKIILILVVITILVIIGVNIFYNNDPKYDAKPSWMTQNFKNSGDYEVASECAKDLEEMYDTKFHVMGYAYHYINTTNTYDLAIVYVYSEEYPQVYLSYCVNGDYCDEGNDYYLKEVKAWEQKNLMYDVAEEIGIDTDLIAIYVGISHNENTIAGDLFVNNKVSIEEIKHLLSKLKEKTNAEKLRFKIYLTEKGNNKQYKEYMEGLGVVDERYIDSNFGNWKKYDILVDSSGTNIELIWENK